MVSKVQKGLGLALMGGVVAALVTGIALRSHDGESASSDAVGAARSAVNLETGLPTGSSETDSNKLGNASAISAEPPLAAGKSEVSGREPASKPLATLNQILAAHGDNDPRLDTELLHLDAPTKKLFRERYTSIAREEQNDRGTIVFLLGRNIVDATDIQFMGSVLKETPCLSLESCDTPPARTNSHEAPSEMALAYSQAVSIISLEKFLEANPNSDMKPSILEVLRLASKSSSAPIARLAGKALAKYDR